MIFLFAIQMDLPQQSSKNVDSSSTKGKVQLLIRYDDSIFSTINCQRSIYCGFTSVFLKACKPSSSHVVWQFCSCSKLEKLQEIVLLSYPNHFCPTMIPIGYEECFLQRPISSALRWELVGNLEKKELISVSWVFKKVSERIDNKI